jgi:phospholipid/cholesterol/gamma-HCH transport system substrate-binding protein
VQKSAPTVGRILVMVGFALSCFGLLLFLWLAFGGSIPFQAKGYRFQVQFPEAVQLAKQADVRISGVPVGKVVALAPDPKTGLTDATIQLQSRYAPLPRDSRAILRQKTLLGETYVELTPGTKKPGNNLHEDATLPEAQVANTVQLDEIFRAFDPKTRRAFRQWMQRSAVAFDGRGKDLNDALGNLAPTVEDSNALLQVLNSQQGAVRALVANTGTVLGALSARKGQLRGLITNANAVFDTTARRNADLKDIFRVFPTFEDESRATLNRLDRFAANTDPLIAQLRPAVRELSPTLRDLARLSPDLQALLHDLEPLIVASRRGLPALQTTLRNLRPLLGQLSPALDDINPILSYIGFYKRELTAFFANTVASTQAVDYPPGAKGPLHYLRTTNPVNLENLAVYPRRLRTNRPLPYALPGAFDKLGKPSLDVFENRQCGGAGLATPNQIATSSAALNTLLNNAFFAIDPASGAVPAPPCRLQKPVGPATKTGSGDYPQIRQAPSK